MLVFLLRYGKGKAPAASHACLPGSCRVTGSLYWDTAPGNQVTPPLSMKVGLSPIPHSPCPLLCFDYEIFPKGLCVWTLGFWLVALFWKVVECLGGGTSLEEWVNYWWALGFSNWALLPVHSASWQGALWPAASHSCFWAFMPWWTDSLELWSIFHHSVSPCHSNEESNLYTHSLANWSHAGHFLKVMNGVLPSWIQLWHQKSSLF